MTSGRVGRPARVLLCAVILALAAPALAKQDKGNKGGQPPAAQNKGGAAAAVKGKPDKPGKGGQEGLTIGPAGVTLRFDDAVIRLVHDWYRGHREVYAGYKPLPPGIARNLARGKPLPPGIAKRGLPQGLASGLPPVPSGYGRFMVGDDLVLVELTTGLLQDIVDILL